MKAPIFHSKARLYIGTAKHKTVELPLQSIREQRAQCGTGCRVCSTSAQTQNKNKRLRDAASGLIGRVGSSDDP